MRFLIPIATTVLAINYILVDAVAPNPDALLCKLGLCRLDQVYKVVESRPVTASALGSVTALDPSNPAAWSTYAERLALEGKPKDAESAFELALRIAPGTSPVLMRAANYYFGRGDLKHTFPLCERILQQTSRFDEAIFSYLLRSKVAPGTILRHAVGSNPRAIAAWIRWVAQHGDPQTLLDQWSALQGLGRATEALASMASWTAWQRGEFEVADAVWREWKGWREGGPPGELLFNTRFQNPPEGNPFNWTMRDVQGVRLVVASDGLEVHFEDLENPRYSNIQETVVVTPGPYRFTAEVETSGLTGDPLPYFHIYDGASAQRFSVKTAQVAPANSKQRLAADFEITQGTRFVEVRLEREPSPVGDETFSGVLKIHSVSLIRRLAR